MSRSLQRVLIADDNKIFRVVLREVFENLEVEVIEAHDGEEALTLARAHSPELIVMDLLMPKRDGFQVASELSEDTSASRPVLFLTTAVYKSRRWQHESLTTYQADEFLPKPIDPDDLKERLSKYFDV